MHNFAYSSFPFLLLSHYFPTKPIGITLVSMQVIYLIYSHTKKIFCTVFDTLFISLTWRRHKCDTSIVYVIRLCKKCIKERVKRMD